VHGDNGEERRCQDRQEAQNQGRRGAGAFIFGGGSSPIVSVVSSRPSCRCAYRPSVVRAACGVRLQSAGGGLAWRRLLLPSSAAAPALRREACYLDWSRTSSTCLSATKAAWTADSDRRRQRFCRVRNHIAITARLLGVLVQFHAYTITGT
jgi:hypothetical protein